jgi:hypothetical protein
VNNKYVGRDNVGSATVFLRVGIISFEWTPDTDDHAKLFVPLSTPIVSS